MSKPKETICLSMSSQNFVNLRQLCQLCLKFIISFVFANRYPTCIASLAKIRLFKKCQKQKNNLFVKGNGTFFEILCVPMISFLIG